MTPAGHFEKLRRLLEMEAAAEAQQLAEQARRLSGPEAERSGRCLVKLVLKDLYDATTQVLEGTTLADLARRTQQAAGPTSHSFVYSI